MHNEFPLTEIYCSYLFVFLSQNVVSSYGLQVPMNSFMCDHHIPLLDTTATCRVPCPNDCIMSEWSHWSECSRSCSRIKEEGLFHRNRTVLAIAGEGKFHFIYFIMCVSIMNVDNTLDYS